MFLIFLFHVLHVMSNLDLLLSGLTIYLCVLCFQVSVGYLLAGSLIGPGGLKFINEIVQVRHFYMIV